MIPRAGFAPRVGAATAALAALAVGAVPAAAAPAPTTGAQFAVFPDADPTKWRVSLKGLYPMQEADAVSVLSHLDRSVGSGMHYLVWGDDGGKEQYLVDSFYRGASQHRQGNLKATPHGQEYFRQFTVAKSVLDEDADGVDEIFAKVRFVDPDGVSRWQVTNVVDGLY